MSLSAATAHNPIEWLSPFGKHPDTAVTRIHKLSGFLQHPLPSHHTTHTTHANYYENANCFFSTDKDYEESEEILKNGYAISRGERDPDIAALAVPIMNSNGTVRGALNILGLVSHFDEEFEKKFSKELKEEATKLEGKLLQYLIVTPWINSGSSGYI